ncbi:MAG: helix-turn-helix domain-containing protein [Pseudomonadota bacterium]
MARTAAYDRVEVLGRARDLFWEKGYHATSLKDLEAALDMRPGSIYAAFGSKEKLFAEALALYAEASGREFDRIQEEHASPLDGLAAHVRSLGGICDHDAPSRACMLVKTVLETPEDDPALRRAAEDLIRRVETGFADRFKAAKTQGEIAADADPERLARRLQAEIFGLRAYAQRSDAANRVRELAEDIAIDIEALRVA